MNCSSQEDLKPCQLPAQQHQANDDSTCDLSCSTLNTSVGELTVADLGASLDLNRHSSSQTKNRRGFQLRSTRHAHNGYDDSDDNLGESFDGLGESFAVDSTCMDDNYMHSRSHLGISMSRLGMSVSNLATVSDELEEDCAMKDCKDLRVSSHSAMAAIQND